MVKKIVSVLLLTLSSVVGAEPLNVMSGFLALNHTPENANGFRILLQDIDCSTLLETLGPNYWQVRCQDTPDGCSLFWWGDDVVPPGTQTRFALRLAGSPVFRVIYAHWTTSEGQPLSPWLSFPDQYWEEQDNNSVADVVRGYYAPLQTAGMLMDRWWTTVEDPLPLSQLNPDDTAMLDWQEGPGMEFIPTDPAYIANYNINHNDPDAGAVLVRYELLPALGRPITGLTSYTNQIEIVPEHSQILVSTTSFQCSNNSPWCVDALNLVIDGLEAQDCVEDYCSLEGWSCSAENSETGCVLSWNAPEGSCLMPWETARFAFSVTGAPPFLVEACYWSLQGIPTQPLVDFATQNWEESSALSVVNQVRGYDPLVDTQGMEFRRRYAVSSDPGLPLEALVCPLEDLNWEWADPGNILAPPDPWSSFSFLFGTELIQDAQALYIRYAAVDTQGREQLCFVNEALLALGPPPPVTDLEIQVEGVVDTLLEVNLFWSPVAGAQSYHVYRGAPYDTLQDEELGWVADTAFQVDINLEDIPIPQQFFRVTADDTPPEE